MEAELAKNKSYCFLYRRNSALESISPPVLAANELVLIPSAGEGFH